MSEWKAPSEEGAVQGQKGGGEAGGGDVSAAEVKSALEFARVLAVMFGLLAVLQLANGAQIALFAWRQTGWVVAGELGFWAQAAGCWFVAMRIHDGSAQAALVGSVLGLGGALLAFTWTVASLVWAGSLSLLVISTIPAAGFCGFIALIALRRLNRLERARALL